jgi:hypothetical protein
LDSADRHSIRMIPFPRLTRGGKARHFPAVQMIAIGPSRHFAAPQHLVAFGAKRTLRRIYKSAT